MSAFPSLPFGRVADRYDETRGGGARGERMAVEIRTWLVPGRVLEVGVGTGVVAAALLRSGLDVVGIDLAPAMLARARARLGPRVALGDALALPVAPSAVDNVVFVAALHAIGDVSGAVAEAARVLRPGGRLIAFHGTPTREPDDDDVATTMSGLDPLSLRRPDSPEALDAAAAAAGLVPVDATMAAPIRFGESPNDLAEAIEQRLWSYLWSVDPATWREIVVPVADRLRRLPEPGRPRHYLSRSRLAVFEAA
jgi:SAM-dependent methyltransferase